MFVLPKSFDSREGLIFFNGNYMPWKEVKIHVLTHALHYASLVFEGLRIYNGKIFKSYEHSLRLRKSAELLDFEIPYSTSEIDEICLEVCKKNGVENGYIRPFAWRGPEQMQVSARFTKINFAVAAWEWPNHYESQKKKGLRLKVAKYRRPAPECMPFEAKTSAVYVTSTLSKHEAENQGFDEALMLDYRGYVAEATASNFFAVFNGEVHTPIADCFLNGITRQTIIKIARDAGLKTVERHIKPGELAQAQEAFLTGTATEIAPIESIFDGEETVYQFGSHELSLKLHDLFHKFVKNSPAFAPTSL